MGTADGMWYQDSPAASVSAEQFKACINQTCDTCVSIRSGRSLSDSWLLTITTRQLLPHGLYNWEVAPSPAQHVMFSASVLLAPTTLTAGDGSRHGCFLVHGGDTFRRRRGTAPGFRRRCLVERKCCRTGRMLNRARGCRREFNCSTTSVLLGEEKRVILFGFLRCRPFRRF